MSKAVSSSSRREHLSVTPHGSVGGQGNSRERCGTGAGIGQHTRAKRYDMECGGNRYTCMYGGWCQAESADATRECRTRTERESSTTVESGMACPLHSMLWRCGVGMRIATTAVCVEIATCYPTRKCGVTERVCLRQ